jgi:hypothetical protein
MCAEKSAGVRYGTEAFALGGFTETIGGIQAAIRVTTSIVGRLTASERLRRETRIENDVASASRLVPEPHRQQRQ